MAKAILQGANLLLLDEPTNHLDILSKENLEEALQSFKGTIIAVSHDRYFLSKIATRIWEFDKGGIADYNGNFEYYLEKKSELNKEITPEKGKIRRSLRKPSSRKEKNGKGSGSSKSD